MRGSFRHGTQRVILPECSNPAKSRLRTLPSRHGAGGPTRPAGGATAAGLAVRRPSGDAADRSATDRHRAWRSGGRLTRPADDRRGPSRRAWYILGVGLIVLGVVLMLVFIGLAVTEGLRVFSGAIDVRVPGQTQVDLPPDEEKMIWARPGDERTCTTTDTDGTDLPVDPSGSVSVSVNGDEWVGVGTFPTGSGHVVLSCDGPDGVIRIADPFGGWGFVLKILLAVFAPLAFGFAGAIVLTVTGVRHYRSRAT